jgi:hypothetical protein
VAVIAFETATATLEMEFLLAGDGVCVTGDACVAEDVCVAADACVADGISEERCGHG